jgi:hypothetical protein
MDGSSLWLWKGHFRHAAVLSGVDVPFFPPVLNRKKPGDRAPDLFGGRGILQWVGTGTNYRYLTTFAGLPKEMLFAG